jgi:putative sigma-54 modulation protein
MVMPNKHKNVKVSLSFRNTEPTEALVGYAEEKVRNCVQKFAHHDTEVRVVLSVEKNRQIAEAQFHCDGADFSGKQESQDLYSSIDGLVDTLTNQLRRHKDRLKSHN